MSIFPALFANIFPSMDGSLTPNLLEDSQPEAALYEPVSEVETSAEEKVIPETDFGTEPTSYLTSQDEVNETAAPLEEVTTTSESSPTSPASLTIDNTSPEDLESSTALGDGTIKLGDSYEYFHKEAFAWRELTKEHDDTIQLDEATKVSTDSEFINTGSPPAEVIVEPEPVEPEPVEPDAPMTITGGASDDVLTGGTGNDVLSGGNGKDTLLGGEGDDELYGADPGSPFTDSDDRLEGGGGNDLLDGGIGNDTLLGEAGDDRLIGYFGDDIRN